MYINPIIQSRTCHINYVQTPLHMTVFYFSLMVLNGDSILEICNLKTARGVYASRLLVVL